MAIAYTDSIAGITPEQLAGFFVGWPQPPSAEIHFQLLKGSDFIELAIDDDTGQVVGFVTAISDGVLSGFIPLLEVLPDYQGQGIGTELMEWMLARLSHLPNVDLLCDPDVVPFYRRIGMREATGMVVRRPMAETLAKGQG
jgi:GNAT superfamily N-acetyltransferase